MTHLTAETDEVASRESGEPTDEAIVAKVLDGDTRAFELLVRRHNRRVFRATRAILKRDDEAEDAMQEAYVSAFSHLAEFQGRARFSTWLVTIAVHEALGRLRRNKRFTSLDDADLQEEPVATARNPEESLGDDELGVLLEKAVDRLPVGFQIVFVMRAVEGMTVSETAEALAIPEETVRTRLHRARGLLQNDLAQKLDTIAPRTFELHLSRCDRVSAAVLARISR
jgi:RNA polymerase sigma-70 factor, ECF subfamily